MKALTVRFAPRAAGQAGYEVSLYEGPPTAPGALITSVPLPDEALDEAARTVLEKVRDQLLSDVVRVAKLDDPATAVGRLLLPGAVGAEWTKRLVTAQQEVTRWLRDRGAILKDPAAAPDRRAWARSHPGTRTYLHIADGVDLHWVPWEIARAGGTLFLQGDAPISRFRVIDDGREAAKPEWQVRVLIVASATSLTAIGAGAEVQAIQRALRPLDRVYDVAVLENPSRQKLTDMLQTYKPHVLHVIAHGNDDDVLLYDGAANIPWGATAIGNDIGAHSWVPEVAYLNACRSQDARSPAGEIIPVAATADDQRRQRGIVDALLARGVLAVVAMQADVRGTAAGLCAAEFYRGLREGSPIDIAAARGRARIAQATAGREEARDPYLPVLTLTVPADDVLRHRASTEDTPIKFLHERLSTFVDRAPERRRIVDAIENRQPVVVLDGAIEMGKSWLLCWTIDLCLRRECMVRYLELGSCRNWLEVLRALRDGNPRRPGIQDPLPLKPSFNWMLTHLANGVPEPNGDPGAVEPDRAGALEDILNPETRKAPPTFEMRACRAFHEALDLGNQKLVIVLDQLEASDFALSPDHFITLNTSWIDPLVARGDGRVHVLLAIRSDRKRDYGLEPMPADFRAIPIDAFSPRESRELLAELFRLKLERTERLEFPAADMLTEMSAELERWADEAYSGGALDEGLGLLWKLCLKRLRGRARQ